MIQVKFFTTSTPERDANSWLEKNCYYEIISTQMCYNPDTGRPMIMITYNNFE